MAPANLLSTGIFLLAAILLSQAAPMSKDDLKAATKEIVLGCKAKVGAGDADIAALKDRKMPPTHEGLCMLECVFDTSNIMQDGKFSKNGMVEAFKPILGADAAKMKGVELLANTCEKEVGAGDNDKCNTAKMVVECMVKNSATHGLELPTA